MTQDIGKFDTDLGYLSSKTEPEPRPKWPELFIELSLRAMRRLHFEYGIWGVGKQGQKEPPKPQKLNDGPGIELADEREVCAAITLEFMNSQMTSGFDRPDSETIGNGDTNLSYYGLDREWPYEEQGEIAKRGRPLSADITFRRIRYSSSNANDLKRVVIECKRFQRARPKSTDEGQNGDVFFYQPQIDGIKKDIEKLYEQLENSTEKFFAHVLIWGIWPIPEIKRNSDSLVDLLKTCRPLNRSLRLHQLRWHPLDVGPTPNDSKTPESPLDVKRWLWIALMEVS